MFVYAANADVPEHTRCRALVAEWRTSSLPWFTTWPVVYELLRVVTHPRVLARPWSTLEAWTFVRALLASPGLTLLGPGERHELVADTTLRELPDIAGNLMHDAHTAILMREHGIRCIYTRDTDFHRFPFLEVLDPLRP